jgi:hypothetical protein
MRTSQILRSLVLPLLLLFAQHGLMLHELRHVAPAERPEGSVKKEVAGLCKLCLAQVQSASVAQPAASNLRLVAGLSYGWASLKQASICAGLPPTPHNRGPPVSV